MSVRYVRFAAILCWTGQGFRYTPSNIFAPFVPFFQVFAGTNIEI